MEKIFKISYYSMIGFIIIFLIFMIGVELKNYYNDKEYDLLILVNAEHKLKDIKNPLTKDYKGYKVSKKMYDSLHKMTKSAGRDKILLNINKGYTTYKNEELSYNNNILSLVSLGYTLENATLETSKIMVKPEYSEYPTGLAINFYKESSEEAKKMYEWLLENAYKYGFILRYPPDKEAITMTLYNQGHYRYVGVEASTIMHNQNLCLEEYLNLKGR